MKTSDIVANTIDSSQNLNAYKVVFKCGTSLSKTYNLVDRFSEYLSLHDFKKDFNDLYAHDKEMFAEPANWVG